MKSSDLGLTWRPAIGPVGGSTVKALCAHPDREGVVYILSFGVIFATRDAGDSWTRLRLHADLGVAIKDIILMAGIPGQLVALTQTDGAFAIPLERFDVGFLDSQPD
jgi:hypothetical protein